MPKFRELYCRDCRYYPAGSAEPPQEGCCYASPPEIHVVTRAVPAPSGPGTAATKLDVRAEYVRPRVHSDDRACRRFEVRDLAYVP
jgi:hypothetical protein